MSQVLKVVVTVLRDGRNGVGSSHDFASEEDRRVAMSWPSGGLEQVAFALLSEAVRREALLDVLLLLSEDPGYRERLVGMGAEDREREVVRLECLVREQITTIAKIVTKGAVSEALQVVLDEGT